MIQAAGQIFVAFVVLTSGFSSLVCQGVWDRVVRQHFGGDNVSSAIVASTFLLGLGAGALAFGRRFTRPFRVYGAVEFGIGLYAAASPWILGRLSGMLSHAFAASIDDAEGVRANAVLACILFLLPPCLLMGGSLPLMLQCFVERGVVRPARVGWLYGMNTAGAALGTIAAPFLLLNRLAIGETLALAGAIDVGVAVAIVGIGPRFAPSEPEASGPATPALPNHGRSRFLLTLAFGTGALTIAFETAAFRHAFVVNPSSPYNYALVVGPFLVAVAAGSMLFTRMADVREGRAYGRMAWLALAASAAIPLAIHAAGWQLEARHSASRFRTTGWEHALYFAGLVIPYPFFTSGIFPWILTLSARSGEHLPRETGLVSFVNAVGAFTGAMAAQFLGFELLGLSGVTAVLVAGTLGVGVACAVKANWSIRSRGLLGVASAAIVAFLFLPPGGLRAFVLGREGFTGADRLDVVEGKTGVALLKWREDEASAHIYVNGQGMSEIPDFPDHTAVAALALSFPQVETFLLLGLGGGTIVKRMTEEPRVRRIEAVDWSHELRPLLSVPRARRILGNAFDDPRVKIRSCDARVATALYPPQSFSFVLDNLCALGWVGSTNVRSIEYFERVKSLLKDDGIYVCRVIGRPDACQAVKAALTHVFDHVYALDASFVLCSRRPVDAWPEGAVESEPPAAGNSLRPRGAPERIERMPEARLPRDERVDFEYVHPSLLAFLRGA